MSTQHVLTLTFVLSVAAAAQAQVSIATVPVGDPGNEGDPACFGRGAVTYSYRVGTYEISAGQYSEFLNAVARWENYSPEPLWSPSMAMPGVGCGITRSGDVGSFRYSVDPAYVNRPVTWVSCFAAMRFVNWLHNGQPSGLQGLESTFDGAYFLDGVTSGFTRTPGARWALPSYDEWHKAAYYKGGGTTSGYWQYATRSNSSPGTSLGDTSRNNANYHGAGAYPIYSPDPYYTTPVGHFRNSPGPYGTFDMNGNVAEWCEALTLNTGATTVRGGSYSDQYEALRSVHQPMRSLGTMDAAIGFRVVRLCPADFNNDGIADFSDYLDFVAALSAGAPTSDFNRDGVSDLFDYLDFVQVFNAGC